MKIIINIEVIRNPFKGKKYKIYIIYTLHKIFKKQAYLVKSIYTLT